MSRARTGPTWHQLAGRFVVVGLAVVVGVSGAQASPAPADVSLTAVSHLIATVHGDRATVSWRAPTNGKVATYQIEAHRSDYYNLTAPDFGTRIVRASSTSIVWPDLPLGQAVYFTVSPVGAGESRPGSVGPYNSTGRVTASNSHCSATNSRYCVVVDTDAGLGTERRPGAGLLHGTVSDGNRWVKALRLTHWRISAGNTEQYRDATAVIPPRNVIEILSDAWFAETVNRAGFAADPWTDWSAYTRFISSVVRRAQHSGEHPIWEIQNEPETYPYNPAVPPTSARVEEQYLQAYRAIKKVAPHARVIAPSVNWHLGPAASRSLDVERFVGFAASHRMHLYALAWHNNSSWQDQDPLIFRELPQSLRDQAQQVRELIAAHPGIGKPKLYVDENSSRAGQFIPGFTAGYLAAEDQAGVDEANRACWRYPGLSFAYGCFGPNLGQLLNANGNPNATYWVMADYGVMSGERVRSEVSSVNLSALAVTSRSSTTRILLGRHQTCSQRTTGPAYCSGPGVAPAPMPTVVKVLVHTGARSATVHLQSIPNTRSDLTREPAATRSTVKVRRGVATVRIPSFADGAAYFLTVKPDSAKGAPAASGRQTHAEVPAAQGSSEPTRVLPSAGGDQRAMILHAFDRPLMTLVTDQYGDPVVGQPVSFVVAKGFGHFANSAVSATAVTNRYGIATSPTFIAGLRLGRWGAAAYLARRGSGSDDPVAYFGLRNTLS